MNKRGVTILEVVLSLAVVGIVFGSIYPIIGWLISRNKQLQFGSQAALILQTGQEAAYNAFLAQSVLPDPGTYSIALNDPGQHWELLPDSSPELVGRFERTVTISRWCRNSSDGTLLQLSGNCIDTPGYEDDQYSRVVETFVSWTEASGVKTISAKLLLTSL